MSIDGLGIRHGQSMMLAGAPSSFSRGSMQRKPVATRKMTVTASSSTTIGGGRVRNFGQQSPEPSHTPTTSTSETESMVDNAAPPSYRRVEQTFSSTSRLESDQPCKPIPARLDSVRSLTPTSHFVPSSSASTPSYNISLDSLNHDGSQFQRQSSPLYQTKATDTDHELLQQPNRLAEQRRGHDPPGPPSESYSHSPGAQPYWIRSYWRPSYNMFFFLIAGVAFAMGHHFFYDSLDGRLASNQIRMLRYGAALSFLCKASLAASVILAFRQRVWLTVRRKVMSLEAVDSLFAAAEDLSAIFSFELLRQARVAVILAVYVWCTPLVVILTSDTLSVRSVPAQENVHCHNVRTLNFAGEETNDWRESNRINNRIPLSVNLWNSTAGAVDDDGNQIADAIDYYTSPSWQFEQIATLATFSGEPVARSGAAEDICGRGWNCTFTVNFTGPGYRCTELASGAGSSPRFAGNQSVPFDMEDLAPTGNHTYIARTTMGDYSDMQWANVSEGGVPLDPGPYPAHLGALRTEPVLWVGYAAVNDPPKLQPEFRDDPEWNEAYTPVVFACEHYETEYEVLFNYTALLQSTEVKKREFLRPIINTTYAPGVDANDGTNDNTTAHPQSGYILPNDTARYRRAMTYHSLGAQVRKFMDGTIAQPKTIANTDVLQTRLIDPTNWLPVKNLMDEVQHFYEDILLSILSNPQMLAVVWAADPETSSGIGAGDESTRFPCTRTREDVRFHYIAWELWVVYAVAVALAMIGVGFGTVAIWEEGLWRNTRFSSIVAATRGPGLEKVPWTPDGPVDYDARKIKVGYGVVRPGLEERQAAGSVDEERQSLTQEDLPSSSPWSGTRTGTRDYGGKNAGVDESVNMKISDSGVGRFTFGLEGDVKLEATGEGSAPSGQKTPMSPLQRMGMRRNTWQPVGQRQ